MILVEDSERQGAKIKVIGVGGCGGNAINTIISQNLSGVDFIAINTDMQALERCMAPIKIQAGRTITKGLGSGARPEHGQKAVEEVRDEIAQYLSGSDMVFITAGMGKGTGTGGAPVVANVAKGSGALVVAIVTTPFDFEGSIRKRIAEDGIEKLREFVDTLIVVDNQRLITIAGDSDIGKAMEMGNEILCNAVRGITEIINKPGFINVDFADVKTVMQEMGDALMGTGFGRGDNRAVEAAQSAISNPLLEGISLAGAKGVLINIVSGKDLSLKEIDEAIRVVTEATGNDANIIHGVVIDENMKGEVMVTVIATGFGNSIYTRKTPPSKPSRKLRALEGAMKDGESSQKLDIPTFLRRGMNISKNKVRMPEEDMEGESGEEKPSFLKKVMD